MKRIAIAAAAALMVLGTAQAQQRSPLYGELGYSFLTFKSSGLDTNPQALRGIIGYTVHPNVAVEGMLALGTTSDSDRGVDIKLKHAVGLFVKPKYDFGNIEAFARLGWVRAKARASGGGITLTGSDDDFAYGVGANYNFNPKMYAGIDWMRYFNKDSTKIDGVTLSVGYRF
jgi:opacity protein-like surface antigen